MHLLEADIQSMKQDILAIQEGLLTFQDVKNIKQFLKSYSTAPLSSFEEEMMKMGLAEFS